MALLVADRQLGEHYRPDDVMLVGGRVDAGSRGEIDERSRRLSATTTTITGRRRLAEMNSADVAGPRHRLPPRTEQR